MKKFIVAVSDYMGDEPDMYSIKANSLAEVLNDIYGIKDHFSDLDIEDAKSSNGDGAPYIMVFDVAADEKVFG